MAHPYASQAKASQKRRLSALGGKAGKPYGSSSMYKKSSYPGKNAGSSTPMTISGKSARKRADQPAKFAGGGLVSTGAKARPKAKSGATTNIVIAGGLGGRNRRGGGGNRQAVPVPVNRPVPVPVPVGGGAPGGGMPPGGPGPVGAPPGLMGAPSGPPPGPPPGMGRPPPGMAGGGLAGSSYHNWGEGYKAGGVVKKSGGMVKLANMGEANEGSPMKKKHYTVSKKADGGSIEKRAMGGGKIIRGSNRPAAFKPGAVPGQPVVPLTGSRKPQPLMGGLGAKKGGEIKKYQDGGGGTDPSDPDPGAGASGTSVDGDKDDGGFNMKKTIGGFKSLAGALDPKSTGGDSLARGAERAAANMAAGTESTTSKMLGSGGQKSAGFKPGALPYSTNTFKRGGKVHEDEAEDKALIKKMMAKEKYASGGFVPKNQDSKDPALENSQYRNQGTGFNRGGSVKKAGSHSGLGRLQKISAAKAVPAKTEV